MEHYNELSKEGFNILLYWVPGHFGIKGNEAAIKAAKQACRFFKLLSSLSRFKTGNKNPSEKQMSRRMEIAYLTKN